MRGAKLFLFIFLAGVYSLAESQVSQGGIPLNIEILKSNVIPVVKMPQIDNTILLNSSIERYNNSEVLKPFKFAETFDVNINPENSGRWTNTGNGYRIWQVQIKSKGAFSLNLIFESFRLPPNAKLYIYNKNKSHILGAFTSYNNKSYKSLAVSPVRGDELIIQYEEPINPLFKGELRISKVNHDFTGILTDDNGRRPLGISGECNIDINCELASTLNDIKNSVCRIIVQGKEVCTGSLINNTREDKTPYVLTANHCFEDYVNGEQNTVFLFNYESPYCGALDGDVTNSVSGSLPVAGSDSLDFSLVELTVLPPPEYRPFYSGWNRSLEYPDSAACIHHPLGDIKKVAIDYDRPIISSFGNNSDFLNNGFWKTLRWDHGTTEAGSSGGPYYNQDNQIVGTLTGGAASCSNSVNDYFARFDMAWDHMPDSASQLKCWLDPQNTGAESINGLNGYEGDQFCNGFTNLTDTDNPDLNAINDNENGFWGGTNSLGITEYVEKFVIEGDEYLQGLSIGVGTFEGSSFMDDLITFKVYEGGEKPEALIYSKNVSINSFVSNAMNYVEFDEIVEPQDSFFIGINIEELNQNIIFSLLTSIHKNGTNSMYYKQNGDWLDFSKENDSLNAAMAFELIACNVGGFINDTPNVYTNVELELYPNPFESIFNIRISERIAKKNISIYDLLGRQVNAKIESTGSKNFKINLSGNPGGIYFVRITDPDFIVTEKIYYSPFN